MRPTQSSSSWVSGLGPEGLEGEGMRASSATSGCLPLPSSSLSGLCHLLCSPLMAPPVTRAYLCPAPSAETPSLAIFQIRVERIGNSTSSQPYFLKIQKCYELIGNEWRVDGVYNSRETGLTFCHISSATSAPRSPCQSTGTLPSALLGWHCVAYTVSASFWQGPSRCLGAGWGSHQQPLSCVGNAAISQTLCSQ